MKTRTLVGVTAGFIGALVAGALYQTILARRELAATPPPGRLVDVGGHRLHLWCTGEGTPAVILENGLGGSSASWGFVQPEVARFTRVCSYDRAGAGYSDPGPTPRTARRIARELVALLDRGGIGGPVVLVGASLGGFVVRVAASDYADRVSGLVLVDASHEDQHHEVPLLARFAPFLSSLGVLRLLDMSLGLPASSLPPSTREYARATEFRAAGYGAAADEMVHVRESAAEVRATRRMLSIPVVVVTAGLGSDAEWLRLQRDQIALSRRGCQIIAEQSGHAVPLGQPELVVDAIHAVVDTVRSADATGSACGRRAGALRSN